ncbi:MAG: UvrD-helicase domain-containing protein [Clostridia bacterium]|nr:UvrD-helicase domain-containing protein [Clostridia bacterium]
MADINELLSKLNEEQIKPVLDTEGAVLVIAGAGSGKTRVLTSRIAYLVLEKHVNPANIMAITFTNKAAAEMKNRLERIIDGTEYMWVSTIHSMCVRILRRDIDKIGYDKYFTVYDETDKDKVLKRVFQELELDADKLLKSAKNYISSAKNECLSPEEFKTEYKDLRFVNELSAIYQEYENQLMRSNALDFDDLLLKTYELFKTHEEVLDYYAEKFHYIHIDEFQDTNKVQFAIAKMLSKKHGNIFVVGDDDQSIYGWRGAKIENILSFDRVFVGAKVYKLQRNYRSTKKILQLANCIIKNNSERKDKELYTENSDGARVETFIGTDENNEATYVAIQIKSLMARTNYSYKDFAVFMRVNALSRAFEQEFTKYGIPYRIFGGFKFFERKEIKDALSYLKLINNAFDDEAFLRCIGVPRRGIGDKTLSELREFCAGAGISMYDGLMRLDETTIGAAAKMKLYNFRQLIDGFRSFASVNSVSELLKYVLEKTSFKEQFAEKTEENASKLYNISELVNSAEQFIKDNVGAVLSDYLSSTSLATDTDSINEDDAVTVATIHAVKGLEFKCVFVAGLDEKILPIQRSMGDDSELEEERRLMYVAITRARERLYLTRANSRYMYGSREFMTPSRFLKEAQPVLNPITFEKTYDNFGYSAKKDIDYNDEYTVSQSKVGGYSSSYAKTFLDGQQVKENKSANYNGYKRGVKVKHVKFGEGTVIDVKGTGDNLIVDVAFKGVGIKALSVKYAPMEIINE